MAITVTALEGWVGADVLDAEGRKLGRVSDFYFRGPEPLLVEIASGLGGRKRSLAPLESARVARGYVQLGVGAAVPTSGGIGPIELEELGRQYPGLPGDAFEGLESLSTREEHRRAAQEAAERAAALEAEAARLGEKEQAASAKAHDASAEAEAARIAKERAAAEAEAAREQVVAHRMPLEPDAS